MPRLCTSILALIQLARSIGGNPARGPPKNPAMISHLGFNTPISTPIEPGRTSNSWIARQGLQQCASFRRGDGYQTIPGASIETGVTHKVPGFITKAKGSQNGGFAWGQKASALFLGG